MKLWAGAYHGKLDEVTDHFNSSISFDCRIYKEDILGSMAHATMLGECGIIEKKDSELIVATLKNILKEIEEGKLKIDMTSEDIHSFVEGELTARIGDAGKRLHTARSRNDQVALDLRLYLLREADEIKARVVKLIEVLCDLSEKYADTVMCGYTHLQRAQPITLGHHLMAYAYHETYSVRIVFLFLPHALPVLLLRINLIL